MEEGFRLDASRGFHYGILLRLICYHLTRGSCHILSGD
jgi:hypothetical protein